MNVDIDHTVGLVEKNSKLSENVMILKEKVCTECGVFDKVKTPSNKTTKFYQLLSVQDDDNVLLVKSGSAKNKHKRIQMTSTSVRNYASHLCTVAYSNFRPNLEKGIIQKIYQEVLKDF